MNGKFEFHQKYDLLIGIIASERTFNVVFFTVYECFMFHGGFLQHPCNYGYTCKQYFTQCSGFILTGSFQANPAICEGASQVYDQSQHSCVEASSVTAQCGKHIILMETMF